MSHFSETLNRLMKQQHIKSITLCEALSIRKSRFSKIKNGGILPPNFDLIEQIAEAMALNPRDKKELCLSYQMSKFGHTYEQIEMSIERLYQVQKPKPYQTEEASQPVSFAENGHIYTDKMSVLTVVQSLCRHANCIHMAVQPEDTDLMDILGRCAASCKNNTVLHWLFWMEQPENGCVSAVNLDIFSHALPFVCAGNSEIRYIYGHLPELLEQQLFPFFIISEHGVLTISRDCTKAVWFSQPDLIALYEKQYEALFQKSNAFCQRFQTITDFFSFLSRTRGLLNERTGEELYILTKHPCITSGISERDLQTLYLSEDENCNANICYSYLIEYITRAKRENIIFSEQGMQEFFQQDIYYEYSESISLPLSKERRYAMLSEILTHNSGRRQFQLIHDTLMDRTNIHGIDIWSEGSILLIMNFHNEFLLITLQEKSIASAILAYLQYLEEMKVLSDPQTAEALLQKQCQIHQKMLRKSKNEKIQTPNKIKQ